MPRSNKKRELTRDEVYVPPLHELPEEWERNNALFGYRLIKRSGWMGRLYAALIFVLLFVAVLGLSDSLVYALVVATNVLIIVILVNGFIRRRG